MNPSEPPGMKNGKEPYPDLRGALVLTLLAMLAAAFTGVAFIDFGLLAAVGVGQAIGVGAVATMGAQRVPEPQAQRLGLRALDWKAVPTILCLTPAVLLASEIDNIATDWSGGSAAPAIEAAGSEFDESAIDLESAAEDEARFETEEHADRALEAEATEPADGLEIEGPIFDPSDPWSLLSAFIVMVGISPVVEEFLFRGVIQQGLVSRMGMMKGVTMVALLWTLLRPAPLNGFTRFLAAAVASFGLGWALGIVRLATRSILGSILLASSWAAIGLGALALEDRLPLPGLNVEGTHLPVSVTLACVALVAWAGRETLREARQHFPDDQAPAPPPA
jgi:membrane protease YdiL (CAAX protease family)